MRQLNNDLLINDFFSVSFRFETVIILLVFPITIGFLFKTVTMCSCMFGAQPYCGKVDIYDKH